MPEVLTAPIRVLRNAMQGNVHTRLEAAVSEIQRLQGELKTIQHEIAARRFATMRSCSDKSPPPMSLAASLMNGDPDEPWRACVRRNPLWREAIRQACELKLAIAKDEAREVEADVRHELESESFSEFEIGQHPRLKRRRVAVSLWKALREACENERNSFGLWKRVSKQLLMA